MTLDRPYGGRYQKIPPGGTTTKEIAEMPGAPVTIQFGTTCPDALSPGLYLEQEYGVPLVNLPLPIGLENMDLFVETITRSAGSRCPTRSRSNAAGSLTAWPTRTSTMLTGRPVIYGEPELVYAFATLCRENGASPVVIASGTRNSRLAERLAPVLETSDEAPVLLEEADFAAIEAAALTAQANIAIGHSGGKFLSERHGIPVVRVGFSHPRPERAASGFCRSGTRARSRSSTVSQTRSLRPSMPRTARR